MNDANGWRRTSPSLEVLCDKYAWRYVESLQNMCTAFLFYPNSGRFGETVVFVYSDYRSPEDAVKAAKLWTMNRDVLEKAPDENFSYQLAPGRCVETEPYIFRQAW